MTRPAHGRRNSAVVVGFLSLLLALTALLLNGRWLLAQGYERYAAEYAARAGGDNGQLAADLAIRLTPYAVRPHLLASLLYELQQQPQLALEQGQQALRHGASDPFVWMAYAHLRMRLNLMDDELAHALAEVERLAPYSYWLQSRNARLGLQYWEWGTAGHRRLWLRSIDFVLKTDARSFLRYVLAMRREELFCREFQDRGEPLAAWCHGALRARRLCFMPPINPGVRDWCRRNGLSSEMPP
jgi:hypothetical protein